MNFRSFVLVLNFLFAIVYAAFSQNNVDQLFKQAESFANNRDYEKSNDLYNEIIASYTKAENWLKYYETRYAITYNYIDLYQFELAKLEIEDYDIKLIKFLSKGLSQDEISAHLKTNNISPSSLSSIEKRLNKLRIQFKANNAIHLVAIVKDLGLI